jgi:carotenoid cleavage dioxygenase-like enzyme
MHAGVSMSDSKPIWPDSPWFTGLNAPCRVEVDVNDLDVVGAIPAQIDGAFYRVAADHQFPPRFANDVPFNGDGMVSMFRFSNGRVHLKTRYVLTDRFNAERTAGKALFGSCPDQRSTGDRRFLSPHVPEST